MTNYTTFRHVVENVIREVDGGMTWTDIKERGGLPQTVPPNQWVRQLEDDIGLVRTTEGGELLWKLDRDAETDADTEETTNGN